MSILNGFRTKITSFFLGNRADGTPVIKSQHGITSEEMRLQAACNMRLRPEIRIAVEQKLSKELGSVARGIAESRRRYPEAYL